MPQKQSAKFKAAIYARYSSDLQREASIDDQVRVCRERIERDGGTVVEVYSDAAISGSRASNRPGLQKMLLDAKAKRFECVVAEALDRLSRDQEDTANLFKRLRHADVRIVTLSEGEVNELHVGLKSTMNSLFLKDLAAKIKRGQRGAAEAGRSAGGLAYGYSVDYAAKDTKGRPIKGARTINETQAAVVRRIFCEYVAGRGPRSIARDLNAEKIPAPRGGQWSAGTINGHNKRLFGILTNPSYSGEIAFNRVNYRRDPETGKREIATTDQADWVRVPAPELRIVDDETWRRAQELRARFSTHKPHAARRPKHLLSGLVKCGVCGGPFAVSSQSRLACIAYRTKSTCTNGRSVPVAALTEWVMGALKEDLAKPDLFNAYAKAWVASRTTVRNQQATALELLRKEEAQLDAKLAHCAKAISAGATFNALLKEVRAAEDRKVAIAIERDRISTLPPIVEVTPDLFAKYQRAVADIERRLFGKAELRAEAREQLRALIVGVVITPGAKRGEYKAQLEGDPAQVLALGFDSPQGVRPSHLPNYGKGGAG